MVSFHTIRGYDFFEVVSAIQKAIRRNDPEIAGYFALELFDSGFSKHLWKRLLTTSAEDCYGVITKEIEALYNSFNTINERKPKEGGRVFISKAILLLCGCPKSRDSDHMGLLVYDAKSPTDEQIKKYLSEIPDRMDIPEYAYDVHTLKGKRMGKTKVDFIKEEFKALKPKQVGLLDYLVKK